MPRLPRKFLVDDSEPGIYHCVNRSVCRAFLCGKDPVCLPMSFAEYLQLLDWTSREYREDKRGAIPAELAPILDRLSLSSGGWLKLLRDFRRKFRRAAGRPESLTKKRFIREVRT